MKLPAINTDEVKKAEGSLQKNTVDEDLRALKKMKKTKPLALQSDLIKMTVEVGVDQLTHLFPLISYELTHI